MKMMLIVGLLFVAIIGYDKQADAQETTPATETTVETTATADSPPALEEENWCEDTCVLLIVNLPPPPDLAYLPTLFITQ